MEIMNRFDIVRIITDIMMERGYLGGFNISYMPNTAIVIVTITVNNHSISERITVDSVQMCNNPRYMIRLIINDMINQIRRNTNDQER